MPASKRIVSHLQNNKVKFEIVPHKKVFTAYDLAQTLGEKVDRIAKTLLVRVEFPKLQKKNPTHYVLIIPASYQADFKKIKKALKAVKVELASEKIMIKLGIAKGGLVPFRSIHKLEVLMDKSLLKMKDILVGAGSFTDSLRVRVKDLHRLEKPLVASYGLKAKKKTKSKSKK